MKSIILCSGFMAALCISRLLMLGLILNYDRNSAPVSSATSLDKAPAATYCQFHQCLTRKGTGNYCLLSVSPVTIYLTSRVQGPVVQSIVSLTSSLRGHLVKCLPLYNQKRWNFWLKKWEKLLHSKSFSHFFNKNICIFETLTFEILTKR